MKVFVAGVSGEIQYTSSMVQLNNLLTRPGDEVLIEMKERGEVARTLMSEQFLHNPNYDAILMLDLDMLHPPDLLERLRAHDLDMVTGHYFRRQGWPDPMYSIVSEISVDDSWPYPTMMDIPKEGMHEIANAGQGCVLIKREVVQAVQDTLPLGDSVFATRAMPQHSGGYHQKWGSDYAFFTLARDLGYKLWLDASLESKHGCLIWLDSDLYERLAPTQSFEFYYRQYWDHNRRLYGMNEKSILARKQQLVADTNQLVTDGQELLKVIDGAKEQRAQLLQRYNANVAVMAEIDAWIGKPDSDTQTVDDLPMAGSPEAIEEVKENRTKSGVDDYDEERVLSARQQIYSREAMSHVNTVDAREEKDPENPDEASIPD